MSPDRGPILVVEDDPDVRRVAVRALRREGYDVLEAEDGAGALRLAPQAAAVVLDRVLPDGDGLDVLADLRALPETRDLPVVILSGLSRPEDLERALAAGADGVITKPFDPFGLGPRLRHILETLTRRGGS